VSQTVSRNDPCPCGSGLKFKRCCREALENPASVARHHNAVGSRIQAWASEHYGEQLAAAFEDVVGDHDGIVLGDGDLQMIGTWALTERELPDGGTIARRYAERAELDRDEQNVARRIADARLTLLRIDRVAPGRWIDAYDLTLGEHLAISSHDVSRSVESTCVIVGRLMAGPPAPTLWGPVAVLDRASGRRLSEILQRHVRSLELEHEPTGLVIAARSASREITALLAPALRESQPARRAA
jgi:SEC-C motif